MKNAFNVMRECVREEALAESAPPQTGDFAVDSIIAKLDKAVPNGFNNWFYAHKTEIDPGMVSFLLKRVMVNVKLIQDMMRFGLLYVESAPEGTWLKFSNLDIGRK